MFSWFHCLMLSLAGAGAGAAVNWGIYNLAWNRRFISPWGSLPTNLSRRSVFSRIPIVGWLLLRGESNLQGQHRWLRRLHRELDEARRREGCRNAVLCWVAFACSYAGLGLLLLELHAEPDSFFAVRPWSEDFDARPTAYALFGFGGLLVLVMAARAIWRERHRTWLPCVALASCMRQTGTGYLLYGALSVALIFTLPYIVFLSVFRVQQV